MPDFSHLKKLDVDIHTAIEYPVPELGSKASLQVVPATEANKPFFNALLKRARKNNKAISAGAISLQMIEANRDADRELYAQYIIKGWSGVAEKNGTTVPFSPENCKELMAQLPIETFDLLRAFCTNTVNFRDEDALDVEATTKN